MAWLLAVWALVLPTLAAAHDHEDDHDDHSGEPVICVCAAHNDRDDDPILHAEPGFVRAPIVFSPLKLEKLIDAAAFTSPDGSAIRAPPTL
ncbi:MAG: hypothetical protein AAF225_12480 [Pseudomonadota bacterium]